MALMCALQSVAGTLALHAQRQPATEEGSASSAPGQHLSAQVSGGSNSSKGRFAPCEAYENQGSSLRSAEACYERYLRDHPTSQWALLRLLQLHVGLAQYQEADTYLLRLRKLGSLDSSLRLQIAECLFQMKRPAHAEQETEEVLKADGSVQVSLEASRILAENGFAERARELAQGVMEAHPELDEACLTVAIAESKLGHYPRVIELLDRRPMSDSAYAMTLGNAFFEMGRYSDTIRVLKIAHGSLQREPRVYLLLAAAHKGLGNVGEARAVLEEGHTLCPESAALTSALARMLLLARQPAKAEQLLRPEFTKSRLSSGDLELLAQSYIMLDELKEAKQVAELAVKSSGSAEEPLLLLANVLQLEGDDPGALRLLKEHQDQYATSARYLLTLALSYFNKRMYAESREVLESARKLAPEFHQAHYLLACTLMKEGDYGGAVKEYETAIKLAPTVDHYYAHLALALRALGRDREEEECLEKAVHADPAYAPSHYELAELLASKGQVEEAVAELTKAIQCDPQFVSSYYLLATTYRRMGKQDQAEAALRQARKVQYELAELLVSKGQFEQAVAKLRKAIQRDPLFANFYYLLATAYRRMGKQQLAEATLGELGKVQPEGSRDTRDLAPTD